MRKLLSVSLSPAVVVNDFMQTGGCDRRPQGGAVFNSPVVMGGPHNSPQSRFQSHAHHQQQLQQLGYQQSVGAASAPHPSNEHHLTQVRLILFRFLARDSILCWARYRKSVCPFATAATRVDQSKTVEVRITQFSPYSSPIPLVFAG